MLHTRREYRSCEPDVFRCLAFLGPFGQERDRKQREIKDAGLGLLKSVQAIPGPCRGG